MKVHKTGAAFFLVAAFISLCTLHAQAGDATGRIAVLPLPPATGDLDCISRPEYPEDLDLDDDLHYSLETDPFRRCAKKALAGLFGPLEFWQRDGYIHGLADGVTCTGAAKVTSYGPWEGCGRMTASGSIAHTRGCSANPELPFGTLVWTPYGLRYVNDRGGWVKVGFARVYGRLKRVTGNNETANLDYYTLNEWDTLRNAPFAVVKPDGDPTVWCTPKRK
jgi:hypothetical protein